MLYFFDKYFIIKDILTITIGDKPLQPNSILSLKFSSVLDKNIIRIYAFFKLYCN